MAVAQKTTFEYAQFIWLLDTQSTKKLVTCSLRRSRRRFPAFGGLRPEEGRDRRAAAGADWDDRLVAEPRATNGQRWRAGRHARLVPVGSSQG